MAISKFSRIGRGLEAPLDQHSLELLQQDIDRVYLLLANGIGTEYVSSSVVGSIYPTGSISTGTEYLVGKIEGPT